MHKLVKPNGVIIEVNENSLDYAINTLKWLPYEEVKKQPVKRGRKAKADGNSTNADK